MGDIRANQDFWYPIMAGVSNAPSGGDLNGNPWWATNSAFALAYGGYSNVYPDDDFGQNTKHSFSFPQFLSIWSGRMQAHVADPLTVFNEGWYNQFGEVDIRAHFLNQDAAGRVRRGYTWFDWVSDFMRSNLVATSAVNTNELAQWALQSGADYVEDFSSESNQIATAQAITNGIDDLLTSTDDITTGVEQNATTLFSSFHFDRLLPETYTGGDPTIEIFPESTIGGVHVSAVRGSIVIPNGVAYWVNLVSRFIWSVLFLVAFFALTKNEYTYWVSLGHTEGNAA